MKIILAGQLENISTRQDGSVKLSFGTQELDPSQAGSLFQLRGKYIKAFLSDNGITQMEEKVIDQEGIVAQKPTRSASKRLRNVLFVFWQQQGFNIEFEAFYEAEMERLIEGIKAQLTK